MSDVTDQAPPVEVTIRDITELVRQFDESGWGSLELDIHGMHLVLGRDGAPIAAARPVPVAAVAPTETEEAPVAPAALAPVAAPSMPAPPVAAAPSGPAPASPERSGADLVEVRSPVVGAFWAAPSPGEPPFVQVGDTVAAGQQLAIVEVMKLMSDISAPTSGVVVETTATNAEMVEYDQLLFRIDPGVGADDG